MWNVRTLGKICFDVVREPYVEYRLASEASRRLNNITTDYYDVPSQLPPNTTLDAPTGRRHGRFREDPDILTVERARLREESERELMWELIFGLLEEYNVHHDLQESQSIYRLLKIAIRGLPNVTRLSFSNARYPGIAVSTSFMPEYLKLLNQYFPVSEGSFYALYREDDRPPCQGFLQV